MSLYPISNAFEYARRGGCKEPGVHWWMSMNKLETLWCKYCLISWQSVQYRSKLTFYDLPYSLPLLIVWWLLEDASQWYFAITCFLAGFNYAICVVLRLLFNVIFSDDAFTVPVPFKLGMLLVLIVASHLYIPSWNAGSYIEYFIDSPDGLKILLILTTVQRFDSAALCFLCGVGEKIIRRRQNHVCKKYNHCMKFHCNVDTRDVSCQKKQLIVSGNLVHFQV